MPEHDDPATEDISPHKPSPRKRKKSDADVDEFHDFEAEDLRLLKRIEIASTEPSNCLHIDSRDLSTEYRTRLWYLLRRLVKQHNWVEASGVLSVLLTATCKEISTVNNRFKYSVLMEVLDHIDHQKLNFMRVKHIYDTQMRRMQSRRVGWRIKNQIKVKLAVHLEFILFCLISGNISEAHQASISITQNSEAESDPMASMVLGLVFYQLWYSSIPEFMQRIEIEQVQSPDHTDVMDERSGSLVGNMEGQPSLFSIEVNSHFQYTSNSSVVMNKKISEQSLSTRHRENTEMEEALNEEPHGFYVNSAENEGSHSNEAQKVHQASALSRLRNLDPSLFPVQIPENVEELEDLVELQRKILNNDYKDAVKYLQLALSSSPQGSNALLPLVQLLLVGGHVTKAFDVLENFCQKSEAVFPFRLRATLLEQLDHRNYQLISSCYEHIVKTDPTCRHSISRLINMHQFGEFGVESLLEMIAQHLDATDAESNTWREFAMCFLKLVQQNEDRHSTCLNGEDSDLRKSYSDRIIVMPKIFTTGNSGKGWKFRCRWWLRRYFSSTMLKLDIAAGDIQLLSYKAACAAHMYGQDFDYVSGACDVVDQDDCRDMFLFLQLHKRNSLRIHLYYQKNSKASCPSK